MNLPEIEQKILKFWHKKKIFDKSLRQTRNNEKFILFEGPPFANGLPGIHHMETRAFKDAVGRYKTMRGFFVPRKAGWDTHGLPTEIAAEKKLGIKTKRDIEKIGLKKFIKASRESVFTYKKEWEQFSQRIGYWLDLKNPYVTCSNEYIESLWWIVKELWHKGLLYKDYKVVPYCPRCGTSLSSHEVAQGYKNVKDNSIYFKLPVKAEPGLFFLVWTTTPWTLPGNTAIAVGENIAYVKVKSGDEHYILAKERLNILKEPYEIETEFLGGTLIGREYEPLYRLKTEKPAYRVIAADFVSIEDGSGIVHIAPAFGVDDMEAAKANGLPVLLTVDEEGKMKEESGPWAGKFVKDADKEIISDLKKRGLLFKEEIYEHEYPFCWRCDSILLYYAKNSWFIKMSELKNNLLASNEQINWLPDYIKHGRFGEWLKDVKDWNLSRERYWGTPLPVWQCQNCHEIKVVGSIKELGQPMKDLHRPFIDQVTFECPKCNGSMKRTPEVLDCWFDSGSMPYAQWHYPFENREKIDNEEYFPADFICEAIDQTRGWFYTLLAIATALGKKAPYKNVVSMGLVLDAKGQKMSKSKGNVVVPTEVIDQFGADAGRWYFYTVNQAWEFKRFDMKDVRDKYNRFLGTFYNTFVFFKTYSEKRFKPKKNFKPKNVLDRWIVSLQNSTLQKMEESMDSYDFVSAARIFEKFVDELSNWHVRRSRRRFQKPKNIREKNEAAQTLYLVLLNCAKMAAPFIPFLAEEMYLGLRKPRMPESVHLCEYPNVQKEMIDENLEKKMESVRQITALALGERAAKGIKVRQPLKELIVKNPALKKEKELMEILKEEVNVKEISFDENLKDETKLDTRITKELKEEGIVREVVRQIQDMRKEAGLTKDDVIGIAFGGGEFSQNILPDWAEYIKKENLAREILAFDKEEKYLLAKDLNMDDMRIKVGIKK